MALMVDKSNIVAFPLNINQHGGFAFVIAYLTLISLLGYPIVYLEVMIGQVSFRNRNHSEF